MRFLICALLCAVLISTPVWAKGGGFGGGGGHSFGHSFGSHSESFHEESTSHTGSSWHWFSWSHPTYHPHSYCTDNQRRRHENGC